MTAALNRERLGKVLALLSSPVDGEALAAARMVVKLLAAADMRPEDLANDQGDDLAASLVEMLDRSESRLAGQVADLRHQLQAALKARDDARAKWAALAGMERKFWEMKAERDYARERNAELRAELKQARADRVTS
jgi:hypothetical protein